MFDDGTLGGQSSALKAATVVVLWSQLAGFLTKLEAWPPESSPPPNAIPTPKRQRQQHTHDAPDAPKDAITSYREECELPSSSGVLSDDANVVDLSPFSVQALHARICKGGLSQIAQSPRAHQDAVDELVFEAWQDSSPAAPQRTLVNVFQRLENLTLERSNAETGDDINSLREQDDASITSSFYRLPIVSLLCHCLLEGGKPESPRRLDEDQISTEGEDVCVPPPSGLPSSSRLLHDVFNSSLFNFCLDRLVEARNRYHAKAVMRSVHHQPPPTSSTTTMVPATNNKVRQEIQSVHSSSFDEADSYVKKCEKLQERLIVQKRARECELREQARARRNLRVQVSAQLHLFRELADLAVSPIQFVEPPTEGGESSETDDGNDDQRLLRPQLAVPSVPAELAAVLRDERIYSLQVKRAVESIVALKANQLDLVIANFTLEEIVRRHLKQPPPTHRPLSSWIPPPPPPPPRLHHLRHVSKHSGGYFPQPPPAYDPLWDRPPSRFASRLRAFDLMSSSTSSVVPPHRHLHVSPILRPLQSSPHLSSSEIGDFPELRRPFVSARLIEDSSPPLPPCRCPMPRWSPPDRRRREFDPVLECQESHPDESNTSASPPGYFVHSREATGSFGLGRPPIKSKSFVESGHFPPPPIRELCQSLSAAPGGELTPSQTLGPVGDETSKATSFKVSTPSKRGLKTVLGPGWQIVKKTMNQLTRGASSTASKQLKSSKAPPTPAAAEHNLSAALSCGQLIPPQPVLEHTRGRTLQLCSPSPPPVVFGGSASFVEQRRSNSCGKRSATHNTTADGGESPGSMVGYA